MLHIGDTGGGTTTGTTRTTRTTTRATTREAGRAGSRPRSRRADAFILQPRFLRARYYLRFPDLRDSEASTLRTSDWETPNCLAVRVGVIPALKVARTALTWPATDHDPTGVELRSLSALSVIPGSISQWRVTQQAAILRPNSFPSCPRGPS